MISSAITFRLSARSAAIFVFKIKMNTSILSFAASFLLLIPFIQCNYSNKTLLVIKEAKQINYSNSIADGVSTFKDLLTQSAMFIDKTLLIKEILQNPHAVQLIICPKGWGKTNNLDMLKTFISQQVDAKGNAILPIEKTSSFKLFHDGIITLNDGSEEKLPSHLLISEHAEIIDRHLGQHVVIYLDLKHTRGDNYEDVIRKIREAVRVSFEDHKYLLNALQNVVNNDTVRVKGTAQDDLERFDKILHGREITEHLEYSLYYLCALLHDHFRKKVFILIDEYDVPLRSIYFNGKFPETDVKKLLMFFELFLGSIFKDNVYLMKGIITGTLRMAQQTVYSKWNNVVEYNIIYKPNPILRYYGFHEEDVQLLFDQHRILRNTTKAAKRWYNGYCLCVRNGTIQHLYNPSSVIKFLKTKNIQSYWEEKERTDFIETAIRKSRLIRNKITDLLQENTILINMDHLRFGEELLLNLKQLFHTQMDEYRVPPHICELFFSYLLQKGYLAIAEVQYDSLTMIRAKLPNDEVAYELTQRLIFFYSDRYGIDDAILRNAAEHLGELVRDEVFDVLDFKDTLKALYASLPPFENILKKVGKEFNVKNNEDLVASVMYVVALKMQCISKFEAKVYYKSKIGGDIVIFEEFFDRITIIRCKYDDSCSGIAMQEALLSKDIVERIQFIKRSTYIGMNIHPNGTTDVTVHVQNPIGSDEFPIYFNRTTNNWQLLTWPNGSEVDISWLDQE
ncbi:uncharacterized protein LOC135840864 [Planococcus citri]|uniref:uncharacterized protein LOC135840864 n=1 Tax=Planococcus citri TaxID=170843 RepID=UPI0031F7D7DA